MQTCIFKYFISFMIISHVYVLANQIISVNLLTKSMLASRSSFIWAKFYLYKLGSWCLHLITFLNLLSMCLTENTMSKFQRLTFQGIFKKTLSTKASLKIRFHRTKNSLIDVVFEGEVEKTLKRRKNKILMVLASNSCWVQLHFAHVAWK